jgi:1,3-beta-glucanosyltransferase GAS5
MTTVFSGGLVYEWSQEVSNYGLVSLSNGNITLLTDYYNLKSEFEQTPNPSGDGGYKSSGSASTCPANSTDFTSWAVIPAMPAGVQNYINNGAGTPLGYNGPSNQGAGSSATAPVAAGTNTATGTSCPSCSGSASGSSNSTSSGNMLLPGERGVAGGAILAAIAAIIGAIVII